MIEWESDPARNSYSCSYSYSIPMRTSAGPLLLVEYEYECRDAEYKYESHRCCLSSGFRRGDRVSRREPGDNLIRRRAADSYLCSCSKRMRPRAGSQLLFDDNYERRGSFSVESGLEPLPSTVRTAACAYRRTRSRDWLLRRTDDLGELAIAANYN